MNANTFRENQNILIDKIFQSSVVAIEVHHLHVYHSVGKLFKEAMISETVNKIG